MRNDEQTAAGTTTTGTGPATLVVRPTRTEATPPSGVSATLIWNVRIADTQLVRREITIAPGGCTGWHYHDGPVVGRVTAGTLTYTGADRSVRTYRTGDVIVEPVGANHVHIGRNDGTIPVVLDALYILPVNAPFAQDAPNPACGR